MGPYSGDALKERRPRSRTRLFLLNKTSTSVANDKSIDSVAFHNACLVHIPSIFRWDGLNSWNLEFLELSFNNIRRGAIDSYKVDRDLLFGL